VPQADGVEAGEAVPETEVREEVVRSRHVTMMRMMTCKVGQTMLIRVSHVPHAGPGGGRG
jgi:hypothetical protein